jgi:hypothetical protein
VTIAANDRALRGNLSRMLESYGADQAAIQRAAHLRRGRSARTFRYAPGWFHREACRTLGYGDSHDVARAIHAHELEPYLGVSK